MNWTTHKAAEHLIPSGWHEFFNVCIDKRHVVVCDAQIFIQMVIRRTMHPLSGPSNTKIQQVVREFWQKAASPSCHPRVANGFVDLDPIRPWDHVSQFPKRHLDRFNCFWVHHCKGSRCFSIRQGKDPPNCPFSWEDLHPIYRLHGSLGPPESAT